MRKDVEIIGQAKQLIAEDRIREAAPEMLEMLQQLIDDPMHFVFCKQQHWADSFMVLSEEDVKRAEKWQSLLDLVAKATGGTK